MQITRCASPSIWSDHHAQGLGGALDFIAPGVSDPAFIRR